jgi:iron-sulfur cluster assembly accessory protein
MSTVQYYQPATKIDVQLTDAAKKRLLSVLRATENAVAMRLSIKKRGCSGFAYELDPVEQVMEQDHQLALDAHYVLAIDPESYHYFPGLVIDYVKHGLQHKFAFQNPKQTGQCGCGESFTIS